MNLDYIQRAKHRYATFGFQDMDVPWWVSKEALNSTKPVDKPKAISAGNIASGEQGFVQMMIDNELAPGCYQTTTPCHRPGEIDHLHSEWFLKLELILYSGYGPSRYNHDYLASYALEVLSTFTVYKLRLKEEDHESDLYIGNIEIGSYGIREYKGHHWLYGTGIAEPRFSIAIGE